MGKLGDLLRETREAQGLSLEQVEQTTKIRYKLLNALEQEAYEELPAPVFVKGFLRNYALLLELDVHQVLQLYHEAVGDADAPYELHALREPLEREPSRAPVVLGILSLVALLVVAGWIMIQQGWIPVPDLRAAWAHRSTPTATPSLTTPSLTTLSPSATQTQMAVAPDPTASSTATQASSPTVTSSFTLTVGPTGTPSPEPTVTETGTGTATATSTLTLVPTGTATPTLVNTATPTVTPTFEITTPIHVRLEYLENVWMRIYSDGAKIFEGEAAKGSWRDWTAQEQLYVHAAYGNAVRATANGVAYGLLGETTDSVRVEWIVAPGTPSVVSPVEPTQVVVPQATPTPAS